MTFATERSIARTRRLPRAHRPWLAGLLLVLLVVLGAGAVQSWHVARAQAERALAQVAHGEAQAAALALRDARRFVAALAEPGEALPDTPAGWARRLAREHATRLAPEVQVDAWAAGGGPRLATAGSATAGPPPQAAAQVLAERFADLPPGPAVGLGAAWPAADGRAALPVLGRLPDGTRVVVWLPGPTLGIGREHHPPAGRAGEATTDLVAADGRRLWPLPAAEPAAAARLVAEAPVPGSDARVRVSLDRGSVTALWLRQSGLTFGVLAVLLVAATATAAISLRRLRRAEAVQRRIRREASRADALLRQALDASHDATWQYQPGAGLVLHQLPAALRDGDDPPATPADRLARSLGDAGRAALWAGLDEAATGRRPIDRLLPVATPDGARAWFHLRGGPVTGDGETGEDAAADRPPAILAGTLRDVTAWVGAREAVADSAEALERMGQIADVGHWRIDLPAGVLVLGATARRILGGAAGPVGEGEVDPWTFGLPVPGAGDLLRQARQQLQAGGDDWDLVLPADGAEAGRRWLRCVGSAHRVDGRLVRIDGAVQDVTAMVRMRAEVQALEERARWLGEAVAASGQLVIVTDTQRRALWCNEAFTRVSGYTLDDIRGRNPGDLLQAKDVPPGLRSRLRRSLDAGQPVRGVRLCNVARDGRRYWIDLEVRPVFDDDGRLRCYIGLQTDVTRDRDREAALRDATRRFELATAQAQIGIWDHDLVADEGVWSDAMYTLFELDRSTWRPTTAAYLACLHPADRIEAGGAYQRALAEPATDTWAGEYRIRRADGGWRWVRSIARFERDADGRAVRAIGSTMDVSLAREIEAERAARAEADARSRAKSEFLSRISHELRTPMNAVLGYAQLLRERMAGEGGDPQRLLPVQRIEAAGWHLIALIDDLLDLSRIEAGQLAVQLQPTDLAALAESASALLLPRAEQAGVRLTVRAPRPVWAQGDGTRLTEVVGNLVDNGIKYGRRGGRVDVTVRTDEDGWASVEVADDGIGLSAAQLGRLFQPFDRLGREASTVPGTGIGLSISHALVERMGGELRVASEEGAGSRFTVRLPAAEPARPAAEPAPPAVTADATRDRSPVRHVLVVEDSEVNQLLVAEVLGRLRPHWPVTRADGLAAARPVLADGDVDVLLLDLHLPDGHGLDLLAEPVVTRRTHDLRVVVLSADVTPDVRRRLDALSDRLARPPAYLPKPFDLAAFARVVDAMDEAVPGPAPDDAMAGADAEVAAAR